MATRCLAVAEVGAVQMQKHLGKWQNANASVLDSIRFRLEPRCALVLALHLGAGLAAGTWVA